MARNKSGYKRRDWEEWYADAKAYYEEHGELLVPGGYVTAEGYRLGRWIERQRARYNGVSNSYRPITKTEIAVLERIGMVWKLESRHSWEEWIALCADYVAKHGDLRVAPGYTKDDYALGEWIKAQRKFYSQGLLTDSQISDLEAVGMIWSIKGSHKSWDEWYKDALRYYEEHGDLRVPLGYETRLGEKLGVWISEQRRKYAGESGRGKLSKEQVSRLNALDMVWDISCSQGDEWESMYAWVSEYKERHGKLPTWPRGIKAPNGRTMDGWIRTQRTELSKESKVSPERASRLNKLGIYAWKGKKPETA